mmetsp:Transcript_21175/g.55272  ORF Transcript_21175/g.55272 Transcript_21175/m.55272 type:complete len:285 (+) Transcript_21175:2394-3248(+)
MVLQELGMLPPMLLPSRCRCSTLSMPLQLANSLPPRSFPPAFRTRSFLSHPQDSGNPPAKRLLARWRTSKFCSSSSWDGRLPPSLLLSRYRCLSFASFDQELGMEPVSSLLSRYRYSSSCSSSHSSGSGPTKPLPLRSRTRRSLKIRHSAGKRAPRRPRPFSLSCTIFPSMSHATPTHSQTSFWLRSQPRSSARSNFMRARCITNSSLICAVAGAMSAAENTIAANKQAALNCPAEGAIVRSFERARRAPGGSRWGVVRVEAWGTAATPSARLPPRHHGPALLG